MSRPLPVNSQIYSLSHADVEGFDSLAELALDMRWSWNHAIDEVWRQLDPALWKFTKNPKFRLDEFVDSFISSCFVHLRKPDADIFRAALDTAQVSADQVIYIENTPMFVEVAEALGIRSILHVDYKSTCAKLASFGLKSAK